MTPWVEVTATSRLSELFGILMSRFTNRADTEGTIEKLHRHMSNEHVRMHKQCKGRVCRETHVPRVMVPT